MIGAETVEEAEKEGGSQKNHANPILSARKGIRTYRKRTSHVAHRTSHVARRT